MATINDPRFRGNSTTPEEREVATADVACKNQVNLIGTWFTADTASQKELNAQKESDFAMALKAKSEEQKQPTGPPRPRSPRTGPGAGRFLVCGSRIRRDGPRVRRRPGCTCRAPGPPSRDGTDQLIRVTFAPKDGSARAFCSVTGTLISPVPPPTAR